MFGRFARHVGFIGRFFTKLPPLYYVGADMEYGFYTPPNRHTADQVPWQNMEVTHTVDLIGATSVQIKKNSSGMLNKDFALYKLLVGRSILKISLWLLSFEGSRPREIHGFLFLRNSKKNCLCMTPVLLFFGIPKVTSMKIKRRPGIQFSTRSQIRGKTGCFRLTDTKFWPNHVG